MASFEVIAMALAPQRYLSKFSDYYLRLGASRVRIFFDGSLQESSPPSGVELVECDDEFWRTAKVPRPAAVEDRQRLVYNRAYASARSDWVLIVDIDEFVFGDGSLSAVLAQASGKYEVVRFGSAEAVFIDGDRISSDYGAKAFRRPCNRYLAAILPHLIYPGLGHLFIRGLLGHSRGKQAVRAGIPGLTLDIHDATADGTVLREYAASEGPSPLYLAHFDAISFVQWRQKWERRVAAQDVKERGRKRERQLDLYEKQARHGTEESLFRRLYCLNDLQFNVLRALGLLVVDRAVF